MAVRYTRKVGLGKGLQFTSPFTARSARASTAAASSAPTSGPVELLVSVSGRISGLVVLPLVDVGHRVLRLLRRRPLVEGRLLGGLGAVGLGEDPDLAHPFGQILVMLVFEMLRVVRLLLRHRLLLLLLGRESHEMLVMLLLQCGQGGRWNVHLVGESLRGNCAGGLLLLLHHHHVLRRRVLMNNDDGGVHVRRVEVDLRFLEEIDLALLRGMNLFVLLLQLLVMVIKCFTLQRRLLLLRLLWVFELLRLRDRLRLGGNFLDDGLRFLGRLNLGGNFVLLGAFFAVRGRRRRRRRVVLLPLAVLLLFVFGSLGLEVAASLDRVKQILQVLEIRLPGLLGGLPFQQVEQLLRRSRDVLLVLGVGQLSAGDSLGEVVDESELFFREFDGVVVAVGEVGADSGLGQLE